MAKPLRLLIVDDSEDDAFLMQRVLTQAGYQLEAERVQTREALEQALDSASWDVLISDYRMPRFDTYAALAVVQSRRLNLPCIVVSGAISMENAIAFVKAGACDFVEKGDMQRLIPVIERELKHQQPLRVLETKPRVSQSLGLLPSLLTHLSDAVALLAVSAETTLDIVYVNPTLAVLLGQAPQTLLGANTEKLIHDAALRERLRQHVQLGQAFTAVEGGRGDGLWQWQAHPLSNAGQRTDIWVLILRPLPSDSMCAAPASKFA